MVVNALKAVQFVIFFNLRFKQSILGNSLDVFGEIDRDDSIVVDKVDEKVEQVDPIESIPVVSVTEQNGSYDFSNDESTFPQVSFEIKMKSFFD
jgi:hypothetical protein